MSIFMNLTRFFSPPPNRPLEVERALRVVNRICIVFLLLATPYYFIFETLGMHRAALAVIPSVASYFICILLNFFGFWILSGLLLVFFNSAIIFFFSCLLTKAAGAHYVFFALVMLPLALFGTRRKPFLFLGFSFPVLALLLLEYGAYSFFNHEPLNLYQTQVISISASITTFLIIVLAAYVSYFERDRARDQLEASNDHLKEANVNLFNAYADLKESQTLQIEMANQVAYAEIVRGIAHEIKNPLHMIRGSADLIQESALNSDACIQFSGVIIGAVDRLIKVMEPMLKYGRPLSQIQPEVIHLHTLLSEILQLSEGILRQKKLKLTLHCDPLLSIFADKSTVAQVFINLIINAQQYTPVGGTVSIQADPVTFNDAHHEPVSGVCIGVKDTGVGISPDNLRRIFEPFFTSKSSATNVGLGLSIVFKYVTENKGKIEVESEEGVGTTFRIYLPSPLLPGPSLQSMSLPFSSSSATSETIFFGDDVF